MTDQPTELPAQRAIRLIVEGVKILGWNIGFESEDGDLSADDISGLVIGQPDFVKSVQVAIAEYAAHRKRH